MVKPKFWRNPRVNASLLARKLRGSKRQITFLQRASVIPASVNCSSCGKNIEKIIFKLQKWKCSSCRASSSVFRNTFMADAKISARKILMLGNINSFDKIIWVDKIIWHAGDLEVVGMNEKMWKHGPHHAAAKWQDLSRLSGLFRESNECFERVLKISLTLDAGGVNFRI